MGGLLALAAYLIYRSFSFHRKQETKKKARKDATQSKEKLTAHDVEIKTLEQVAATLSTIRKIYRDAIGGLLTENRNQLAEASPVSMETAVVVELTVDSRPQGPVEHIKSA